MKAIKPTEPLETQGFLDKVVFENEGLRIDGWVASLNSGPIEGFKISCGGKEFTEFELMKGLDSPDVKQVYPTLDSVENCRFRLRVPMTPEERSQLRDCLIILTPLLKMGEGQAFFKILECSIPIPGDEHQELKAIIGASTYFLSAAQEFLGYFVQRVGLEPTDSVLDVGCGMGRMAYPLAYYLAPTARYEGFDIVKGLIEWAQKTIPPRFPHFNFRQVDIYNKMYNPEGTLQAAEFPFPYENESFDFVFLTSVFTHVPANEVRHYLEEIHRVLKPGGRCLCTVLLHNEESARLIAAGKSRENLVFDLGEYLATELDVPEKFTGFREHELEKWIGDRGFKLLTKYYGSWCGRSNYTSYQDMLILQKEG